MISSRAWSDPVRHAVGAARQNVGSIVTDRRQLGNITSVLRCGRESRRSDRSWCRYDGTVRCFHTEHATSAYSADKNHTDSYQCKGGQPWCYTNFALPAAGGGSRKFAWCGGGKSISASGSLKTIERQRRWVAGSNQGSEGTFTSTNAK